MRENEKHTLYPCTGTQDRLGVGPEKGHVFLVYDRGRPQYLSLEEAQTVYGADGVEVHPKDGTICPECCGIAVRRSRLQAQGIDVNQVVEVEKNQDG